MVVKKAYKFRIYPTKEQETLIAEKKLLKIDRIEKPAYSKAKVFL
ncbi:helix-turn-helix domain-containing protein [Bacillus sp. DJP31]